MAYVILEWAIFDWAEMITKHVATSLVSSGNRGCLDSLPI